MLFSLVGDTSEMNIVPDANVKSASITTRQAEGRPEAQYGAFGLITTVRPDRDELRTDYVNYVNASDDQRNDVRKEHEQYAEHGLDRGQVQIRLIVQLYLSQPTEEGRSVDTCNSLHHTKVARA